MGFGFGDILGGTDDSALKETQKDNRRRQEYIEEQTGLAVGDINKLYPYSNQYLIDSYNAALGLMGNSAIPQMQYFQQGNVGAQNTMIDAMPQYQAAIFGQPVDYSQFQAQQFQLPDQSNFQVQMPQYQNPYGEAPVQQQPAQQGMNPQQMYQAANTYNKVAPMFGGEPLWGGSAASGGGAGAGGASGGGSSAMAAAGPWAALAAGIAANEMAGQKDGRRADFTSRDYWKDIASGAVGMQDGGYVADKLGFEGGKDLSQWGERMTNKVPKYIDKGVQSIGDFLGGLF